MRTAEMLPHYISKRLSDKPALVVLSEPRRLGSTGAAGSEDHGASVGQEPTRPPPVPLPRPRPPQQAPTGAVIIDTMRPPEVPDGYDVHIHVPTQRWYYAKGQATQWLHPVTRHLYQIGLHSSRGKEGHAGQTLGVMGDGHIPLHFTREEVQVPLHVRQRVLLQPPYTPPPWTAHTVQVQEKADTVYTMWYYTDGKCWSWVHPTEYATARMARSEGEFQHYGEGRLVQLNLQGQPVAPRGGKKKRGAVSWAETTHGASGEDSRPAKAPMPCKAPPAIMTSLRRGAQLFKTLEEANMRAAGAPHEQ